VFALVLGIHMHNMFLSGTDSWGGTWIRRTTPFREAWVLTPLMPFPCMHGLTGAHASITGLECVGFSRPHPHETLFQIVAVAVTRKKKVAKSAAI
jgi:hypothetical protein